MDAACPLYEFPPYQLTRAGALPVLRWPALDAAGVDAVVTTRHGGVSAGRFESLNLGLRSGDDVAAVLENRRRAAQAVGLGLDDLVFADQVHGRGVALVGRAERGRGCREVDDALPNSDALVTTEPDVGLVVMVADCVPIVAVDPVARVLACVHAGWRGTTSGVTEAAVEAMVGLGAGAERLVVGIGPAIGPDRYQVGDEVASAVRSSFGESAARLLRPDGTGPDGTRPDGTGPDGTGRWLFDLWAANIDLLRRLGVGADNISLADVATGADFYSHRAAQPTGRFAAIARLRP